MCGIVGLFLKDPKLEPKLGAMLTDMLITMTDRGPESAGIAIYVRPDKGHAKLTVQSADPRADFKDLARDLGKAIEGKPVLVKEIQRDPLSRRVVHCDLYAVNLQARLDVEIPILARALGIEEERV